ncbi:carbohydrate esterase family 1 protein [Coniochaeta sp. 2T2.1]|nr:carbohydrate esterase family 1 protein [Coniochaeta sp. 2T2.1]
MKSVNIFTRSLSALAAIQVAGAAWATTTAKRDDTATAGCGLQHPAAAINTTQAHSLMSSNRNRTYSLHLPAGYNASAPHPVVMGFHGSGTFGGLFEADTKLSEDRYSAGKIMVYPDGVRGNWAGANYSNVSLDVDLQFVHDLLMELRDQFCIDNSRIYATGLSNGAGFVNAIACNAVGGEFAAFAPHSGAYYNATDQPCTPARSPFAILSFHGGNDTTVPYDGGEGEGGTLPAIRDWLSEWAKRDNCTSDSGQTVDSFDGDVHHVSWNCDGEQAALQHYKIDDLGHCWASTEPNLSQLGAAQGPTHIDASRIIMDFFDNFTKSMQLDGTNSTNSTSPDSSPAPASAPANPLFLGSVSVMAMIVSLWIYG